MPRFLITAAMLAVLLSAAIPVFADDANTPGEYAIPTDSGVPVSLEAAEATAIEEVELPVSEIKVETHKSVIASAGYRFMSFDGYGGRAAGYEDFHSGPTFSLLKSILGRDHKFIVDGSFITDNDYYANLTYDYMGAYRIQLRTDSLYHNLDRLPDFSALPFGYDPKTRDEGARYGNRVEQDLATVRARLGSYPIHLNLQYWRMLKEGDSQLRFADHAFFPLSATNSFYTENRRIDRETHEGKLGFDAHIGPIDLIYDFTVRQYSDRSNTPVDTFVDRQAPGFYQRTPGGSYEHNETPESQYLSHNIKMHTEQTGGFVAAAAYSIAQRKNRSSLTQVSGVKGLTDALQTAAGDLVYTPCKEFSLAVRFRHQEIDRDTAVVSALNFITPNPGNLVMANQGIDTQRDVISAILSIRPVNAFTVKGEYRGEYTHRSNTDSWDPYAKLSGISIPSNTERHKGILTVLSKPYKNLRLKAKYTYTTVNQPEYGISFDERHEGQLQAIYSLKERFGITTNYQVSHETNDSVAIRRLDLATPNYDQLPVSRERRNDSATASVWGNLLDGRISLTGTAGLIRSKADQQTLFAATSIQNSATASNYTSQALLYGITAAFRPTEKLETSIAFQQIRAYSEFDPVSTLNVDASGVKEISALKTLENSVSFKADYQLYKNISCGVDYRYREYNDDRNPMFDGLVHSVITNLTAKW